MWRLHFSNNLIQELKNLNLYAVIGPNFSVGQDHPRIMHLINMKRNNLMFENFRQAGISSIPEISWYNSKDFNRWVDWLKNNDTEIVSITVQCMIRDGKYLLESLSDELHDLEERINRPLHFVFIGANEAIFDIISEFDKFSLITFQPFAKAFFGRKVFLRDGKIYNELYRWESKEQLLFENTRFYKELIEKVYYGKVERGKGSNVYTF